MNTATTGLDRPQQVHGRKATGFELFFDLVFVVAVAQLSGASGPPSTGPARPAARCC